MANQVPLESYKVLKPYFPDPKTLITSDFQAQSYRRVDFFSQWGFDFS